MVAHLLRPPPLGHAVAGETYTRTCKCVCLCIGVRSPTHTTTTQTYTDLHTRIFPQLGEGCSSPPFRQDVGGTMTHHRTHTDTSALARTHHTRHDAR